MKVRGDGLTLHDEGISGNESLVHAVHNGHESVDHPVGELRVQRRGHSPWPHIALTHAYT